MTLLGLEAFVQLLPWGRRDYERSAMAVRDPRWFQWGYFTELRRTYRAAELEPTPVEWYIIIRLPSWLMKQPDYGWGEPCWHQRVLVFLEKLPCGDGPWGEGKWEMREWPEPRA